MCSIPTTRNTCTPRQAGELNTVKSIKEKLCIIFTSEFLGLHLKVVIFYELNTDILWTHDYESYVVRFIRMYLTLI